MLNGTKTRKTNQKNGVSAESKQDSKGGEGCLEEKSITSFCSLSGR